MEKIGKYEIESLLGQGAMGKVYAGVDPLIGRKVAIKVLSVAAGLPEKIMAEVRERFVREAQAAGNLNHACIVTIYDIDHTPEGEPYIAMEYVPGKTLKDLNKETGRWSADQTFNILQQVASGLAFAHERGVVHRDVKPENIMVGDQGQVKIMDFGVAHLGNSELTQTGQSIGTPAYMSPEQVRGQKVDGRSDLFSLGIIGYEMLAGERPFTGNNITTIAHKIVFDEPTPLNNFLSDLPFPCHAIVDRLIRKEPDSRFANGGEVVTAIGDWRAGKTTEGVGEGTAILGVSPLDGAAGSGVVAAQPVPPAPPVAPVVPTVPVPNAEPDSMARTATLDRSAPPSVRAESSANKKKRPWWIILLIVVLTVAALGVRSKMRKARLARQAENFVQKNKELSPEPAQPVPEEQPEQPDPTPPVTTTPKPEIKPEPEPEQPKALGFGKVAASFEYQMGKGTLTIKDGNKILWSERFEPVIRYKRLGRSKKKIPLGFKETVLKKSFNLSEGKHQLSIHVHSADLGMDTTRHVNVDLNEGERKSLYIRLRSVSKELNVSLR